MRTADGMRNHCLLEPRHDLLAPEAQGVHDLGVAEHAAGVDLGGDAVEAGGFAQFLQARGDHVGGADDAFFNEDAA